jgi:hypothetical protein
VDDDWFADVDEVAMIPALTALMHREVLGNWQHLEFGGYREALWINGYPAARLIVVNVPAIGRIPGAIREIAVAQRTADHPEGFARYFHIIASSYESQGWTRSPHTAYTGDIAQGKDWQQ